MIVLGLTGFGGAGKSTVADILVKDHGFTRMSFAGPLKQMLHTLDPIITKDGQRLSDIWALHQGDERHIKTWYPEYQRTLRTLGTDCVREEEPYFWVRAAERRINSSIEDRLVFDDVRFPNEAALIKRCNWHGLWHVSRPGVGAPSGHESEQYAGRLGESLTIHNDRTLEMLRSDVELALLMVDAPHA